MVKWRVDFYNVEVGRDPAQVEREIRALLRSRPNVLGLCETVGYDLPRVKGYRLVRDRSNESRANIAAYVRDDEAFGYLWLDMRQTWSRTQHPGQHPPRSILVLLVDDVRLAVCHLPPKFTDNTLKGQWECIEVLSRALARGRVAVGIGDFNRRAVEPGPSPRVLARRLGGVVATKNRIDTAVVRDAVVKKARYVTRVRAGLRWLRLRSDHKHALRLTLHVPN